MSPIKKNNGSDQELTTIFLFISGIFLIFLVFVEGTNVWNAMHKFFFGIFGSIAYIVPFLFIGMSLLLSMDKLAKKFARHRVLNLMSVIVLLCSIWQVLSVGMPIEGRFWYRLSSFYVDGENRTGGGLCGVLIAWPLMEWMGTGGALIILILMIVFFLFVLTGITLKQFLKFPWLVRDEIKKAYQKSKDTENQKNKPKKQLPSREEPKSIPVRARSGETKRSRTDVPLGSGPKDRGDVFTAFPSIPFNYADAEIAAEDPVEDPRRSTEASEPELFEIINFDRKKPGKPERPEKDELVIFSSVARKESPAEFQARAKSPGGYAYPPLDLLLEPAAKVGTSDEELTQRGRLLEDTLRSFGVQTRVLNITQGPTVTRYELQPFAGVKISKITGLADDIALNMACTSVRIEAPIPNKSAVGIEMPNSQTSTVHIKEIINSKKFMDSPSNLTVALGENISGDIVTADLGRMPHLLIAGATGSGKSVCINSIIISLLYKSCPEDVRLILIDPKVVELGVYNGIPQLLVPVVTAPRKAAGALSWAVTEMLNRYKIFAENQVRDLNAYNRLAKSSGEIEPLPNIVIIIDELADLMMVAPNDVEDSICRLTQMARAAGMHLVIATQRPSVDVITGLIKANIPSRIAFAVSSQVDSRTIIDGGGAEKLLGRGDMLFAPVGAAKPFRVQGCFVTDKEVEKIVGFVKRNSDADYDDDVIEEIDRQAVADKKSPLSSGGDGDEDIDGMYAKAVECVVEAGQASTSLLQRRLKLGYARAARMMDMMEERMIIGPPKGSLPRQVLLSRQQYLEMSLYNDMQKKPTADAGGELF
ncbi:MAG: DNA translocase FtsK [Oscillospiraceae bacterium]|jgi:S-DNA-T family DNA segregation ATPase FtsK/SpoIIIE|nr:DNA translocase FtsK [Oscillospiraceae bacterium]